jgi:hypothetical protein
MMVRDGLRFEGTGDGGVVVAVYDSVTENAPRLRTVVFDREQWAGLVSEVSPPQPEVVAVEPAPEPAQPTPGMGNVVLRSVSLLARRLAARR